MNIDLKTEKEIEIMKEGGIRLKKVVKALLKDITVGMTSKHIDDLAENLIEKEGGEPSFKKVKDYFWTTCLPINDQVVHTPPSNRKLNQGDLLTLDIGMYFKGYHTDFATTIYIGKIPDKETKRFLETGKKALALAIEKAKTGNRLGDISATIEKEIYGQGYFVLKELTGHGIGKQLHEDPYVFGFRERPVERTIKIQPGLVIAIEVIYSKSSEEIAYEKNSDWSVVSADRSLSACFEHTVAIMEKNSLVLT
ncbi:MAG: Methionine aminopeptidase [Candidatus Roizmanbacteria bacterium GW2011_GWC2_37_13]|uniref:Methionine aminopeptidase n=1 Tax=Candidatus Roizmanbacteria bacterium GW2011_GWC2_37_13 TaxID=1618486 RepID=A0A0G0JEN3_9BACT|nr:MAG: methionine aminopeptidase, type I, methionyl aminopeptidase [Candidatus Roizmanbacteria bacterium GW2011_GWC1_37_12]KKQ26621.1 MAG: Methionine aminopeptidase [Candidatus Roizmanbacteria bacterium GW2011_GWC2_37_13]